MVEVLDEESVHLTAESVHHAAQARLPEISLATVYNTLNELVAMGEVLEVAAGAGARRYDPNVTHPHHHLVCTCCGALRDVFSSSATDELLLGLRTSDRHGFAVTGVDLVFQGLCPDCVKRA